MRENISKQDIGKRGFYFFNNFSSTSQGLFGGDGGNSGGRYIPTREQLKKNSIMLINFGTVEFTLIFTGLISAPPGRFQNHDLAQNAILFIKGAAALIALTVFVSLVILIRCEVDKPLKLATKHRTPLGIFSAFSFICFLLASTALSAGAVLLTFSL